MCILYLVGLDQSQAARARLCTNKWFALFGERSIFAFIPFSTSRRTAFERKGFAICFYCVLLLWHSCKFSLWNFQTELRRTALWHSVRPRWHSTCLFLSSQEKRINKSECQRRRTEVDYIVQQQLSTGKDRVAFVPEMWNVWLVCLISARGRGVRSNHRQLPIASSQTIGIPCSNSWY